MTTLDVIRRHYAEEIEAAANLQTPALVDALATTPREAFLGPGPWMIATADPSRPGEVTYRSTPDADARHVYHNVLIALDASRALNNGHPGTLASCLDALRLESGMRVLHIGCGVGYYTALAAAVVGPSGQVSAIEIDPGLAARAKENLRSLPSVSVACADGAATALTAYDAILVNAGFTHPLSAWLEALRDNGRLLIPVTMTRPGSQATVGAFLMVTRRGERYAARPMGPVAIFGSPTGRDPELEDPLRRAMGTGRWSQIRSLRRDPHQADDTCCVHGKDVYLSAAERS